MDPVKLDGIRKKRRAELLAQLEELKSELKKLKEERSLPGAKVTDGAPNKLSEMEKLHPFLVEAAKKYRAELREAYSNREPLILSFRDPSICTAASPPGLQNDVDRESMVEGAITLQRAALQAHAMDRNIGNARITGDGEDEDTDVTVD